MLKNEDTGITKAIKMLIKKEASFSTLCEACDTLINEGKYSGKELADLIFNTFKEPDKSDYYYDVVCEVMDWLYRRPNPYNPVQQTLD